MYVRFRLAQPGCADVVAQASTLGSFGSAYHSSSRILDSQQQISKHTVTRQQYSVLEHARS
jgi:hypothetical protein